MNDTSQEMHQKQLEIMLAVKIVDQDLNLIRNKGRQPFLENHPENFSRILHDYSNERKGFVVWKDML